MRLLGFLDLIKLNHPRDSKIIIYPYLILKAPDVFVNDAQSPTLSVGQCYFSLLLNKLESNNFGLLKLPITKDRSATQIIPYFLIQEL